MLAISSVLALGLSTLIPWSAGDGSVPVHNLLVMSTDAKVVAKVKKEYRYGIPLSELAEKFKEGRFVLDSWGNQGAILIDREIPLLVKRESQRDLIKLLLEDVGSDLVVRVADVPEDKRSALIGAIEELFPWHGRSDGFDMKHAAVGVDATFNVTVYSRDSGDYKNIALPMPATLADTRNRALDSYPMPQKGRELSSEERARVVHEGEIHASELERASFHSFGTARKNLAQGLRESARVLERLFNQLDEETRQAAEGLLDKIGFTPALSSMPKGRVAFNELPGDMKSKLMEQAAGAWKHWGFDSLGAAEQFILNSGSVEVTLNIGLRRTFRAFDSQTGSPRSGMVYNFVLIRP